MRTPRFNCSETTLCNINGIPFETLTPEQQNQVRVLAMYFSTPETYHANVLDEIRPIAEKVALQIGDATVDNGVTYYPVTSATNATPILQKPTVDEMVDKLAQRLNIAPTLISSWGDSNIETAFENLGLMPRQKTDRNTVGYLMIDSNEEYPRFKASAGEPSFVLKQYNDYVAQQRAKLAPPATT